MDTPQDFEFVLSTYSIGAFIVYLVSVVLIGVWSALFSSKGLTHYFIGGRQMHKFVVALSAVVSGRSAWLLLGFTGLAFQMGASAVWAAVGYTIVEFFLFWYYAGRLRRFSEVYDCITIPDFFAARFEDKTGVLRVLVVGVIIIFMVAYVSAQFVAGGKAFASGFGLDEHTGIYLTALIVLAYTVLGGFLAVSVTDTFQGVIMLFALAGLPLIIVFTEGGWMVISQALVQLDPSLLNPFALGIGALLALLGIGLGSPGNPQILARYMSIKDAGQLRFAAITGTTWNVVMAVGALFIGMIARAHFGETASIPGEDPENVFPLLAQYYLPPVLFGIVVASIFAAIMSSADSQLLVGASGIVRDIYEKLIRKGEKLNQRYLVLISRSIVLLMVVVALLMGLAAEELVFWLVLFAWGGLGASFGPASILALFWKRTTKAGVISGIITGTAVILLWVNFSETMDYLLGFELYELIPAFFMSAIVTVVVSLFTNPPEHSDEMFKIMKKK
jgi:sodium/proline symporter